MSPGVGTRVAPDTSVAITLSSGHAPVPVPDVSNETVAAATAALAANHLTAQRAPTDDFSATVPIGDVISTDPPSGTLAPYGSTVVLNVSKGPDLVRVPNLFGLTFDEALNLLNQRGFQTSAPASFRPNDKVHQQSPAADSLAPRNSTVTIGR